MAVAGTNERDEERISIRLPDELLSWIDRQAVREQRSRSNMVRLLLSEARDARDAREDISHLDR